MLDCYGVYSPIELMESAIRNGTLPSYTSLAKSLNKYPAYGGDIRTKYAKTFGYGIPCQETIEVLSHYGPFLELGSGNGLWSYWLRKNDCHVIATDIGKDDIFIKNKWITDVLQIDAVSAIKKYSNRNVLIVWPHFLAKWPSDILDYVTSSQSVCYVGEGPFGCCASNFFFSKLDHSGYRAKYIFPSPAWPGVKDYLAIYSTR